MARLPAAPLVFPSPLQMQRSVHGSANPAQGPWSPNPNAGQNAGPAGMGPTPTLVHEAGGQLIQALQPQGFTTFERLFSVLPEGGFYSPGLNPSSPFQFDLGSFKVPQSEHLWLMDYEFSIYRQSGIDPGDFVKADDGRFSSVMGFDINVDGVRMSNLLFQLDPVPIQTARTGFQEQGGRATAAQFNTAVASSFASTAGPGLSLLPARSARQGVNPAVGPFTILVTEDATLTLSCVIFKTVLTPIAKIEGRMMGYLVNSNVSSALVNRTRAR